MRHTCFAFLVALVKNSITLLSNFWADLTSLVLSRSFNSRSIVLMELSGGTPINRFFQCFEVDLGWVSSLWNIYRWLWSIRCQNQMPLFLKIKSLVSLSLIALNIWNFRGFDAILVALTVNTILGLFLVLSAARMRRKILISDCVFVMVWSLCLSFRVGNWLLNSSHSFTDLKIDQVS